jgi:hypothetical protein
LVDLGLWNVTDTQYGFSGSKHRYRGKTKAIIAALATLKDVSYYNRVCDLLEPYRDAGEDVLRAAEEGQCKYLAYSEGVGYSPVRSEAQV